MNEYYIYMTTNLINGKKYIGQHKGSTSDSYLGSGLGIMRAIDKYGKENFSKEVLCFCQSREEADAKEKEYIKLYDAVKSDQFYNSAEGGTGGDGWRACHRWAEKHPEEAEVIWRANGERLQQWVKDNPEDYTEKCLKPFIEGAKKWREEHPEEVQQNMKKVNEYKEKWQREHPEEHQQQVDEWRKLGSITNSQKILCTTTGKEFSSLSEASRYYNVPQPNISKCLKGERKSAGKDPDTGEKLFWKRLDKEE